MLNYDELKEVMTNSLEDEKKRLLFEKATGRKIENLTIDQSHIITHLINHFAFNISVELMNERKAKKKDTQND